ncbi:T-complex protein 1 beta subunit [Dunaliella salina]|uniref:CCT-beta n=1 Tax=Dunaliella salina TaxID=3046 RepID=A0ABQ7GCY7_DUNSA|nr:T-complex protein 1 beta subunit [Dunaliella salina]|eukprot:KAF5832454.1 T-complex protein 1 beta subunit [Dunaliella salina]
MMMGQPSGVLAQGVQEERGEDARLSAFVGAVAIAELVKTTLGPKGMDKILQSMSRGQEVTVTNDGATILKSVYIDNPAAKVLVGKVFMEVRLKGLVLVTNDGATILKSVHQQSSCQGFRGFREASDCARKVLEECSFNNAQDTTRFHQDLMNIAMTTLSSKILTGDKAHFARLAVDAILRLKGSGNLEAIHIIKKAGGTLRESYLDEGYILDKKIGVGQPKRIENARILVANTAMDTDKVKIYGARVRTDSMAKVAEIEAAEKEKMREKCMKIINHNINCFIDRQLIYNFPEEIFADHGVMAIEHADFEGIENLALVLGGEISSTFDGQDAKLGHCKLIEEIMIGEDRLIHFSGVALGEACTIVLRGASSHILEEAERSLHDALCVLQATVRDSRVIYGGGWPEIRMAKAVDELAARTPGKKSLAMSAYARALRALPATICDNAGLDSAELVANLRAAHAADPNSRMGVDAVCGEAGDMAQLGIYEAFRVKSQVLASATEAAEMILRVDEIIKAAPRRRQ